jgi:hypothetical protein
LEQTTILDGHLILESLGGRHTILIILLVARRNAPMTGRIELDGAAQKLQVFPCRRFPGLCGVAIQRGYDQGCQDADDGGHDDQFGDGKRSSHSVGYPVLETSNAIVRVGEAFMP